MSPSVSVRLSFCLLLAASAACTEGEIETAAPVAQTHVAALADGGIALPDAALADAGTPAEELTTTLTTLAEFRGTVDVAAGTMRLEVLEGDAVTDAGLRRAQQGLCTLTIVQDGVAGSGPLNSLELVTSTTGLDAACDGYLASPLFCGEVTVRSFYAAAQSQVFAQIQSLAPSTGFSVQNGDVVPGASSGLGSWAYGDLGASAAVPANAGVRNWVFARSGGNFTFTGRLVANVTELCDGLDNDCDGATDEGLGCRTQGQSCAATVDCSGTLVCTASVCSPVVCSTSYHVESGACVSDTRSCSASNATAATETWDGVSAYGACTISACSAGFALVANSCVGGCGNGVIGSGETCDDGNTVTEECAYGEASCAVCSATCASVAGETDYCTDNTLDASEFCDDGNTINADSCNNSCTCGTGYHAEGGICANDVQACTISNGTATESWTGSAYGVCTPVSCNSTYHIESGACVSDTRSCTLPNATVASELWNGAAYGPCTATACASGYWANAGACTLQSTLGTACTLNAECASGFCATGPAGTANDRCAPTGMNYIPAGTFTMGSPSGEVGRDTDETQHAVTLSRSFFMNLTEVTQGEWKALSGGTNPSYFQSTTGTAQTTTNANDSGPAEQMDWYAAVAFANAKSAAEVLTSCYTLTGCTDAANGWKDGIHSGCSGSTFVGLTCTGYRLPTESEWEYAARGGTTTATYGGNLSAASGCVTLSGTGSFVAGTAFGSLAWYDCSAPGRTQAVGGKTANSFGLSDMLGNVREWTGDWLDTYPATVTDPLGAEIGLYRVFRGGSWLDNAYFVRAADRDYGPPADRNRIRGFRLSRTATRGCTTLPANATAGVEAANASGWGACEATACGTGYHVEGGVCVSDTRSCTLPNATAAAEIWNSGTSSYGPCTASACSSGYTVSAGACVASVYSLGTACTADTQCASGFCATGPDGTANDRCAPTAMNYIPAGTFTMGSPSTEVGRASNETEHSVTISRSFFMGQTEVTQGQWKALSGGTNPSYFQSTTGTAQTTTNANDSGPAELMDWYAAVAFANAKSAAEGLTSCYTLTGCSDAANGWKDGLHSGCTGATLSGLTCTGYRLPTESEWEYAARAGTTTATYGGNLSATTGCVTLSGTGSFVAGTAFGSLAWYDCNAGSRTQAVGGKSANSFGLYDILGNVREWTGDWYDATYPGTVTDPTGPAAGSYRVLRGGSWFYRAGYARAAYRLYTPGDRYSSLGFRLSRTVP